MSVINKMLRDLDRRNAPKGESTVLSQELRPGQSIPVAKNRSKLLVSLAGLGVLGVGGFYAWKMLMVEPPASQVTQAPAFVLPKPSAPTPSVPVVRAEPAPVPAANPAPTPEPVAAVLAQTPAPMQPPMQVAAISPSTLTDASPRMQAAAQPQPALSQAAPAQAAPAQAAPAQTATARETVAVKPMATKPAVAKAPTAVPAPAILDVLALADTNAAKPAPVARAPKLAKPVAANTEDPDAIDKRFTSSPRRDADIALSKAVTILQQGRVDEALDAMRKVLALEPGHEVTRQTVVALMVEQGRIAEAQNLLAEALTINPSQSSFALLLGRLTLESAGPDAALAVLTKHAEAGRQNAQYRGLVAAILQRLGRHGEAVAEYNAALSIAPHMGAWWMGLGISQQAAGDRQEAANAYQRAKTSGTLSAELLAFVDQRLTQLTK